MFQQDNLDIFQEAVFVGEDGHVLVRAEVGQESEVIHPGAEVL